MHMTKFYPFLCLLFTLFYSCKQDIDYIEDLSKDVFSCLKENKTDEYSRLNIDVDDLEAWIKSRPDVKEREMLMAKIPATRKGKHFSKEKFKEDFAQLRAVPMEVLNPDFWKDVSFSDFKFSTPQHVNINGLASVVKIELMYKGKIYKLVLEMAKQGKLDWQIVNTPYWEELGKVYLKKKLEQWQPECVSDRYLKISKSNLCSLFQLDTIFFKKRLLELGFILNVDKPDLIVFSKLGKTIPNWQRVEFDLKHKILNVMWITSDKNYFADFERDEKSHYIQDGIYYLGFGPKRFLAKLDKNELAKFIEITQF